MYCHHACMQVIMAGAIVTKELKVWFRFKKLGFAYH